MTTGHRLFVQGIPMFQHHALRTQAKPCVCRDSGRKVTMIIVLVLLVLVLRVVTITMHDYVILAIFYPPLK